MGNRGKNTKTYPFRSLPDAQGLYHPQNEHDNCGVGFVASIEGQKSHDIVLKGIQILINLAHRGACGCDPQTGDGAGVLIQIPHSFFERECARSGFTLPSPGEYGVGMVFLPVDRQERMLCEGILEKVAKRHGFSVLGGATLPSTATPSVGWRATPALHRAVLCPARPQMDQDALERKLYVVRKEVESVVAAVRSEREGILLHSVSFLAHDRLQGPSAGSADRQVL